MPSPASVTRALENGLDAETTQSDNAPSGKDPRFWSIFVSMCVCLFLSTIEASTIPTALPAIANALHASQFSWIGSAYALASIASLPMSCGLVQAFNRRISILVAICLLALGSGICGSANGMKSLIVGRIIQGLGGGGIQSLTGIILADIISLQERGIYAGLYGLVWCLAASIGPVVGGSLAVRGRWRWIFYLNLPVCLVACMPVTSLLRLSIPPGNYPDKIIQIDWIGNFLVILSTVAYTVGFTRGGIASPWSSVTILVPLVFGSVVLVVFVVHNAIFARHPLVPFSMLTNLANISGYIQTFCSAVIALTVIYYYPIYFQACKGASPATAGHFYSLAFTSLAPAAIAAGFSVQVTRRYRPQMWIGWVLTIISLGLMSTITATDAIGRSIGYVFLFGCGIGLLGATPIYAIQAPLPATQNVLAFPFLWLLRSIATVWGITIGSAVLQNELAKRLSASFIRCVPRGAALMYALIPELSKLPSQTRFEVQVAFAGSLAVLWQVLAAIGLVGFVASLLMKWAPVYVTIDEEWTWKDEKDDQLI